MKKQSQKQFETKKSRGENPEWSAVMIAEARPARDVLPKIFGARTAAAMLKRRGRPKSPDTKLVVRKPVIR